MGRAARKADDPALRAAVEKLRRAGEPLNREMLAEQFGVSTGTVQVVRSEIQRMLDAELAGTGELGIHVNGRTVQEFDGRRLFTLRREADLMQDELGRLATDPRTGRGVSRGEVGHLERGHRKPTVRTLRNLVAALDKVLRAAGRPGVVTMDLLDPEKMAERAPHGERTA